MSNMSKKKRFLTIKEFCAVARVSRTTLYRLIKNKTIPATKIGGRVLIASQVIDDFAKEAGEVKGD
jgi:excisionase family DNA binding protein